MACITPAWADVSADFDRWADTLASRRMHANPERATFTQYFQGEEQARVDGELGRIDKAWRLQTQARDRQSLAELKRFDKRQLTPAQRTSAAIIGWSLEQDASAADFVDDEFAFQQMSGLQVRIPTFMTQQQPLRNARDVKSYLSRLEGIAPLMDQGIALSKAAQARGILMPRFIADKVVEQFEHFLAAAPNGNLLVASFGDRMASLDSLTPEQRETARARAEKIVADSVIPAWRRALALLQAQLPLMTDEAGVWRLPNGPKVYANALRRMTTTDYTPQQIHAIGLREVARIETEMDGLLRQLGYADGSVKDRFAKMEADQQPQAEDPRPELLARYTTILRDAEKRAALMFDVVPKSPVEVRREPALTEKTAAAHYTIPAPDGSRPGIFWAPLAGPSYEIAAMRTLVYHEAVPGHHFQLALQQESTTLPRYRRSLVFTNSSAYIEGWALYAEQLAVEKPLVRRRHRGPPRAVGRRTVPRPPPGRRYRPARHEVDSPARHRLRHPPARGRPLRRLARPGLLLHAGPPEDRGLAREGAPGARRQVRHPQVPRRGARDRRRAADGARVGRRRLDQGAGGLSEFATGGASLRCGDGASTGPAAGGRWPCSVWALSTHRRHSDFKIRSGVSKRPAAGGETSLVRWDRTREAPHQEPSSCQ